MLNIYYQNTRGLRTKSEEFMINILQSEPEIICLTETWLNDSLVNSEYFPETYNVHRRDRNYVKTGQKYGGGVLIAVTSSINAHRRHDLELYDECA